MDPRLVPRKGKYTLIITEKPDAALRIASVLDEQGTPQKMSDSGVPYYIAKRLEELVVVPALGHLYTIVDSKKDRGYPAFTFRWVPRYIAERKAHRIRSWLKTIAELAENAETFIDACDFDVEGCVIGYCILKYACGGKEREAKRMKFSTLTKQELEKSYAELLPHLDFGLIEAGLARHEIDWLYGINLSRALTNATKKWSGRYATLSTGRVQGPTLKFLLQREEAIATFVPVPYWRIKGEVEVDGRIFQARYEKDKVESQKDAEAVLKECGDQNGKIEEVETTEFEQIPPFPFDLGTLQKEAYGLFRYAPRRTLSIAQQLYLRALISYPRTDSQKLPPTIDYRTILKNLGNHRQYSVLVSDLLAQQTMRPNEGRKSDPAHPAIYPTGVLPETDLHDPERKLWDLVVRRFLSVFGESSVKQSMKVCIRVNGHDFYLDGKRTLKEGWIRFYRPYVRFEEVILPPMKKGQCVNVKGVVVQKLFTEPPPRYNPSSLIRKMEEEGIGTKATRADTIQTLYDRRYIEGEKMMVKNVGFEVHEILERHCPSVVSIALTRELETKMNGIRENKEKRDAVLDETINLLTPVLEELRKEEKSVGEKLGDALRIASLEEKTIGACPLCKTGKLIITHSKATGKRFVGCTNYFTGLCRCSSPLPQHGALKVSGEKCAECGWPVLEVKTHRHPWKLCVNSKCVLKKERRKI